MDTNGGISWKETKKYPLEMQIKSLKIIALAANSRMHHILSTNQRNSTPIYCSDFLSAMRKAVSKMSLITSTSANNLTLPVPCKTKFTSLSSPIILWFKLIASSRRTSSINEDLMKNLLIGIYVIIFWCWSTGTLWATEKARVFKRK